MLDVRCSLVSFSIKLAVFLARGGAHMKLRQNGTVSSSIRLAASAVSGDAHMKLRESKDIFVKFHMRLQSKDFVVVLVLVLVPRNP
jgi:hypothetical protein